MRAVPVLLLIGACSFPGGAGGDGDDDPLPIDGEPSTDDAGGDAAIDAAEPIDAAATPWLAGYSHRRRIDLLGPDEPLTNFALLVQLEDDADLRDSGIDSIKFTLGDGTTLTPWEAERYVANEGTLAAWVRVPVMRAGQALYLYYGADSPPAEPAQATWEPEDYALVMHFADLGPWRSATPDDDEMAVAGGATDPSGVFTPMGGGQRFAGNDRIELGSNGSNRLQFGTSSFSYSVLIKIPVNIGDFDMPFYKGGSSAGTPGFDMELGRSAWRACISDGEDDGLNSILCADFVVDSVPILDQWHLLTAVVDRDAKVLRAYRDGVLRHEVQISAIGDLDNSTRLMVSNGTYKFNGDIDDLRVYRSALTTPWIETEWANVFTPETVLRIGADESP
jgi:hypothetical protein